MHSVVFKSILFLLLSKNICSIFITGPSIRKNIEPRSLTAEFILKDCLKDVELMFTSDRLKTDLKSSSCGRRSPDNADSLRA